MKQAAKSRMPPSREAPVYFVYVQSSKGPVPQLLYSNIRNGSGKYMAGPLGASESGASLLYLRYLHEEDHALTLQQLVEKYPFEDGFTYSGPKKQAAVTDNRKPRVVSHPLNGNTRVVME